MAQINPFKDFSNNLLKTRLLLVSIVLLNICVKYSVCQSVSNSSLTKVVKQKTVDKTDVDLRLRKIGEILYSMKTKNTDEFRYKDPPSPAIHKMPTVVK